MGGLKMDNELLKYLTEEDKKRIAERVFEEELRKTVLDDIQKRSNVIFDGAPTVYSRVLEKYIGEMNLYHHDFIDVFKTKVLEESEHIIRRDKNADNNENTLDTVIGWKIQEIGKEVIEESKEELKPIIKEKVFKCCNETLLVAFLSDIVRGMKLDEVVKRIIQESEGDKK